MKKLLNPIEFYNDRKLLTANLIIFAVGTALAVLMKAVFGSPIDLHFASTIVPFETILGNVIAILCLLMIFYLSGKIINKKTRLIDCFNLALYVRIPYYFLALSNVFYYFSDVSKKIEKEHDLSFLEENTLTEMVIVYLFTFLFLGLLLLFGVIIYRSFRTITNSKKTTDYLTLVGVFLTITIISTFLYRNF